MYEFGVDFVARCLAGEALAKADETALNLIAGDNIDITYDSSTGETVISNSMEVDNELSLSSENSVQNKVITDALRYKPDTYTGETKVANQKIVQLTRAQYDAIQNKDPNTYYMITDDTDSYVIRAGTGINIDENGVISLDADYGASLEMTIDHDTYVITTVLKDQNGNTLGQAQTIDLPLESVVVNGRYDTATKTIILTLKSGSTISIPVGDLVSGLESESNKVTSIGSSSTNIEYPSAKAVYDLVDGIETLPASTASDEGKVLTVDVNGDAEWVTPSTGVTDYTLLNNKPLINNVELNGNKTAADLGLVESSELNNYLTTTSATNTYQTKTDMANYLTTTDAAQTYLSKTDAASTYQPIGNYQPAGNYLTPSDISDMATQTWVGQQGFLTSAREVPTTLAGDAGKVLTATGAGAYQWSTVPTPQNMEVTTNKVTSLSASSTDTQYPSAKCVYDLIGDVETILATLTTP